MKSDEIKLRFVEMRAEGQSFAAIAAELHISKGTCSAWEKELAAEIKRLRQEALNALFEEYAMHKEARIKRLGSTLEKIEAAIDAADLGSVAPEKLLELKLKYAEALKKEYTGAEPPLQIEGALLPPEEPQDARAQRIVHGGVQLVPVHVPPAAFGALLVGAVLPDLADEHVILR